MHVDGSIALEGGSLEVLAPLNLLRLWQIPAGHTSHGFTLTELKPLPSISIPQLFGILKEDEAKSHVLRRIESRECSESGVMFEEVNTSWLRSPPRARDAEPSIFAVLKYSSESLNSFPTINMSSVLSTTIRTTPGFLKGFTFSPRLRSKVCALLANACEKAPKAFLNDQKFGLVETIRQTAGAVGIGARAVNF